MISLGGNMEKQGESELKKLLGLILFRIVTITVLLGSTTYLNFRSNQEWAPVHYIITYSIGLSYLMSIFYLLAIKTKTSYRFQARIQVFADILFWSCLIYLTGGLHSPFTFLYAISVIYGAVLLGRRGAIFAFILSTVLFGVVIWMESYGIYHSYLSLAASFTNIWDLPEIYQVFLNVCMFFLTTLLASYLASQLERREQILTRQRMSLEIERMLNRSIVAGISSGFITIDLQGVITFFNVAAERISGVPHDKAQGRHLGEVMPQLVEAVDKEGKGEKWERHIEIRLDTNGQEARYAAISFSDLIGPENRRDGSIVIIEEITERRRLEELAQRNQRLAAIGELAAGMAHEIRNPLASISGSVQMLSGEFSAEDDNQKLMEIILREIDRLNSLISDFLSFARPKPLNVGMVNLQEILEDITELIVSNIRYQDVRIRVEFQPKLPELVADAAQVRQMLWNILNNAAEAAARTIKPVVWVKIYKNPTSNGEGESIVHEIRDNGPGMEKEVLERIFDPFFTTKNKGTGLGMSIVYQIVQAHKGKIDVYSRMGEGTVFLVTLPCRYEKTMEVEGIETEAGNLLVSAGKS